jgi:hypothetical protein
MSEQEIKLPDGRTFKRGWDGGGKPHGSFVFKREYLESLLEQDDLLKMLEQVVALLDYGTSGAVPGEDSPDYVRQYVHDHKASIDRSLEHWEASRDKARRRGEYITEQKEAETVKKVIAAEAEEGAEAEPPPERVEQLHAECRAVLELYNLVCTKLKPIKMLTAKRITRIREAFAAGYTIERLGEVFRKANSNEFFTNPIAKGKISGWTATFDWLIQADKLMKIEEGFYYVPPKTGELNLPSETEETGIAIG